MMLTKIVAEIVMMITVFILIITINIIVQLEMKHLLLKFNAALPTGRSLPQINQKSLRKTTASKGFVKYPIIENLS